MDFVSRDHLLLTRIKADKKITWYDYIVFALIWGVVLSFIVLIFSPISYNDEYILRLGFWMSYHGANHFSFGWLNWLMLFVSLTSIVLLIGILYLSFYKANRKILNTSGYLSILGLMILVLPLSLIGHLSVIHDSRWLYKQLNDHDWTMNAYGISLLVVISIIYAIVTGLIVHWYVMSIRDKIQYKPITDKK